MSSQAERLYKEDFYAWTRDRADALRRLADQRWNGPLGLLHLAEEVEDSGRGQQWAVESQLERVLEHLLKLEHSPGSAPRRKEADAARALPATCRYALRRPARRRVVAGQSPRPP